MTQGAADGEDCQGNLDEVASSTTTESIQMALASLQLPHMPQLAPHDEDGDNDEGNDNENDESSNQDVAQNLDAQAPTIRILVVADVDLTSASALAEYSLQQKRYGSFDASMVDLCIACGPFCRDNDLKDYHKGRQQRSAYRNGLRTFQRASHREEDSENVECKPTDWTRTPFFRTPEENAALEGYMTAALSQLESIVCRVVYCPGSSDPLTVFDRHYRLTPNSRNIHQQWLPLAPYLGCGGLFFLENPEEWLSRAFSAEDNDLDGDWTEEERERQMTQQFHVEVDRLRQKDMDYYPTLSRLLQLAPPSRKPPPNVANSATCSQRIGLPFQSSRPQSILVTNYASQHQSSPPPESEPFYRDHADWLCLEIASGTAQQQPTEWNDPILWPGSLRERGEFCVVYLQLLGKDTFEWKVAQVDRHRVGQFP